MKRRFFLDVVVGQCTTILELLASKDQTLLIGRDALLVLDLRLHIVDGIRRLDLKGDGLSGDYVKVLAYDNSFICNIPAAFKEARTTYGS